MDGLFREESLQAREERSLGGTLVISPPGSGVLAVIAVAFIGSLVAFLNWAEYSRRVTTVGQLVPDRGLIEIPMPHTGVVIERLVAEGSQVEEDDLLFVVASQRSSLDSID
ncbi:MAG: HlyD family secretion protein, partial [Planctomycetota bacterium]